MAHPSRPERQLLQAPRFAKAKRRLPAQAQLAVDDAVRRVVADPLAGEAKAGALRGVRVIKFRVVALELLLAYQFDAGRDRIEVLDVGPHESFYRDLQRYLGGR